VPSVLFNICVCERKLVFLGRVLSFILYWCGMVRRKLTIPERWQAVGMHNGGVSHRQVADHFMVNHSIIVRMMYRFRQTGNVTDRPRAGRPHKTTLRARIVQHFYSKRLLRQFHALRCRQTEPFRACMELYWPKN
jgi:IS30 family transposase